jgi:hypothetical protein
MMLARVALAALFTLAAAGPLAAQESGSFVVRLGRDTTSVERFMRSASHIEVDQVGRAPRVLRRHYAYDFDASGAMTRAAITVTLPSAAAGAGPFQQINVTFSGDSAVVEARRDTVVSRSRAAVKAGALVVSGTSPWVMYEGMAMQLVAQKADTLGRPWYYIGAASGGWVTARRLSPDSVEITTTNLDRYHAKIDPTGHVLHVVPLHGTAQFTVDRVENLDLEGIAASFAGREQAAGQMGALSTRDTVRATTAGASLWIDYGRPAKRGRAIFGAVVPYGEVWRTGANAATQFKTDKALVVNGTTVPAGFYTLWTIPSPQGWKLIVNDETGQWGTEHKAAHDKYTIDMKVSTLTQPVERFTIGVAPDKSGGTINLDWDTTRASVPFTVKK